MTRARATLAEYKRATKAAAAIEPLSPLSLDEAAELCLRGKVKASTLRGAADRGELVVERLGRKIFTTPAAIDQWRERCRSVQRERDFGCDPQESKTGSCAPQSILSETEKAGKALAAELARLKKPKKYSPHTSPTSINQTGSEIVRLPQSKLTTY